MPSVRVSCQTSALCMAAPLFLSQSTVVSRWLVMPSAATAERSAPTDRSALKMLVGAVEISRFGGQSANEQIYRACLDQYRLIGESGAFNA